MTKNQFYINKNIHYLINKDIREYDIKRAGLHALKYLKLIDDSTYDYWITRNKIDIDIFISTKMSKCLQRQNDCITSIVDTFIKANEISSDKIISRKRDAVFLFDTKIKIPNVNIFHFISKHKYTSYYKFDEYELYYDSSQDVIEIKGINTKYTEGHPLIPYIKKIIKYFELVDKGFIKYEELYNLIHSIRNSYCNYLLPSACYRELNYGKYYRVLNIRTNEVYDMENLPSTNIEDYRVVINYNFMKFIVPFINILPHYRPYEQDKNTLWKRNK